MFGIAFILSKIFRKLFYIKQKAKRFLSEITVKIISMIFFCLSIIIVILIFFFDVFRKKIYSYKDIIISFFIGVLFSLGLMESGMAQRHSVLLFLSISKSWVPTLICLLGAAVD